MNKMKYVLYVILTIFSFISTASAQSNSVVIDMLIDHYNASVHVYTDACTKNSPHAYSVCIPVNQLRGGTIGYIDFWEGTFEGSFEGGFLVRLYDHRNMEEFAVLSPKKYDLVRGDKVCIHGLVRAVGTVHVEYQDLRVIEMLDSAAIVAEMQKQEETYLPQFRTWTINGKEVTAKFVDFKGMKVILENQEGKQKKVTAGDLKKEDIKEYKRLLALKKAAEEQLTPRLWKNFKDSPFKGRIAMIIERSKEIVILKEDGTCENYPLSQLKKDDNTHLKRINSLFKKVEETTAQEEPAAKD